MKKIAFLLVCIIVLISAFCTPTVIATESESETSSFTWKDSFDGMTSGHYTPYGIWWNNATSERNISYDGTLGNEGGFGDGFCYYYLNDYGWTDFTMEFDVNSVANPKSTQYGVMLRASNPNPDTDGGDGYTVMYDGSWMFVGKLDGSFTQVKTGDYAYNPTDHGITPKHWKIECKGNTLKVYLNQSSTAVISVTDDTFIAGQVGFRTFTPANTAPNLILDNLAIDGQMYAIVEEANEDDFTYEEESWTDDFSGDTSASYTPYGLWWNNATSDKDEDYNGMLGNEGGTQNGYTYYYLNDYNWADFTMEFDVVSVLRPLTTTYGVMLRAANPSADTDAGDGYTIMYDGSWVFCAKLDGTFTQIKSGVNAYNPSENGITLKHWKIVCSGNNIKVYFNGATTPAIDFNDKTFRAGKVGFRVFSPAKKKRNVVLDNLSVNGTVRNVKPKEEAKIETEDFAWSDEFNSGKGDCYLVYGRWWNNCTSADSGERYDGFLGNEGGDGDGYCYYYLKKYKWVDYTMEFDVVSTAKKNTTYGIMLRAANPSPDIDAGDGYTIMYDGSWIFCAKLNGSFKQITSGLNAYNPTDHGITVNHWKVVCNGSNIKLYLNHSDTPCIDFTDETYRSGYVGFRNFAPKGQLRTVVLDNLKISGTIQKSASATNAFSNRRKGNVYDYSMIPEKEDIDLSQQDSLKVLAIGNSYTEDATAYFNQIASDYGYKDVVVGNMFIGGCNIATHWSNIKNKKALYQYQKNTDGDWVNTNKVTVKTALLDEQWDVVVINQQSIEGTDAKTYGDLINIVAFVRGMVQNPNCKIGYQMTWGYGVDNINEKFVNEYGSDSMNMYRALVNTAQTLFCENYDVDFVIPVGTAIENLRENGFTKPLLRDNLSHLSFDYGRYTASLTWFAFITNCEIDNIGFVPNQYHIQPNELNAIKESVLSTKKTPYDITMQ